MTIPDAVLDLIRTAAGDVDVFDGRPPVDPPERYAVAYIDPGLLRALAVCAKSDSMTVRWQVTTVAPDSGMARWLATAIRDGIVDQRPIVEGWSVGLVKHEHTIWPARDEQLRELPVQYIVDQYKLLATRS